MSGCARRGTDRRRARRQDSRRESAAALRASMMAVARATFRRFETATAQPIPTGGARPQDSGRALRRLHRHPSRIFVGAFIARTTVAFTAQAVGTPVAGVAAPAGPPAPPGTALPPASQVGRARRCQRRATPQDSGGDGCPPALFCAAHALHSGREGASGSPLPTRAVARGHTSPQTPCHARSRLLCRAAAFAADSGGSPQDSGLLAAWPSAFPRSRGASLSWATSEPADTPFPGSLAPPGDLGGVPPSFRGCRRCPGSRAAPCSQCHGLRPQGGLRACSGRFP